MSKILRHGKLCVEFAGMGELTVCNLWYRRKLRQEEISRLHRIMPDGNNGFTNLRQRLRNRLGSEVIVKVSLGDAISIYKYTVVVKISAGQMSRVAKYVERFTAPNGIIKSTDEILATILTACRLCNLQREERNDLKFPDLAPRDI